ncbi:SCO family protein [Methylobacter psychrophilus]|uniref:SCO family protein n=1 Tax=Methylobacter psychrophilus TaxID=96941 RepID=UPI0021D4B18D|nr:SCO family protein [Methylobacter psychrophilus]
MSAKIARTGVRAFLILLTGLAVNLGGSLAWAAPPGSAWGANYFPNVELVTQDGKKVRFYDDLIKDKVFAINFIYTRCTDSCPLETAALRKVQQALGDRMGKDVVFYSISIDGDRDNPNELKDYAARFKVGPGWTFLTGRPEDVTLLRQKLGMYRSDGQAEKELSEHGISILMGNEHAGQWIKRSPFEETKALVRVLGTRLQAKSVVTSTDNLEAVRAPAKSTGEALFRSKCEACHSTGKEDGLGPGLQGVTEMRDRAWLTRWIKTPDKLLADKDPIAVDLYNRYEKIVMPNLRLSDGDVEALIAYMEAGSLKVKN